MNSETSRQRLPRYYLQHVKLTSEYLGGVVAGFGLGVVTLAGAHHTDMIQCGWTWVVIPGFLLVAIGASLARRVQNRAIVVTTPKKPSR